MKQFKHAILYCCQNLKEIILRVRDGASISHIYAEYFPPDFFAEDGGTDWDTLFSCGFPLDCGEHVGCPSGEPIAAAPVTECILTFFQSAGAWQDLVKKGQALQALSALEHAVEFAAPKSILR